MIGNDGIKACIREGDGLRIHSMISKAPLAESLPGLLEHPLREIRERNLPAGRNALPIGQPEPARPTAQFQEATARAYLQLIKDPVMPAIRVGTKAAMQLDARVEIGRIFI